jgi:hypothetical protein
MIGSRRMSVALAIAGAIVAATLLFEPGRHRDGRVLEIRMRSSDGEFAEIWWDSGSGFRAQQSARLPLARTPDAFQSVRFTLPAESLRQLRLDPIDRPGEVFVEDVRVLDAEGTVIRDLNPRSFLPAHQIASVKREGRLVRFVTDANATDPFLLVTPVWRAEVRGTGFRP